MACIQALSGFLGIKKAELMVEVARRDARRVTDVEFVADMQGMRFASLPLFYLILLLTASAFMLTVYMMWKLPEAEELSRLKKSMPAALTAVQP